MPNIRYWRLSLAAALLALLTACAHPINIGAQVAANLVLVLTTVAVLVAWRAFQPLMSERLSRRSKI